MLLVSPAGSCLRDILLAVGWLYGLTSFVCQPWRRVITLRDFPFRQVFGSLFHNRPIEDTIPCIWDYCRAGRITRRNFKPIFTYRYRGNPAWNQWLEVTQAVKYFTVDCFFFAWSMASHDLHYSSLWNHAKTCMRAKRTSIATGLFLRLRTRNGRRQRRQINTPNHHFWCYY